MAKKVAKAQYESPQEASIIHQSFKVPYCPRKVFPSDYHDAHSL